MYVARSVWARIEERLVETIDGIPMGDVRDFGNFMGAVIKKAAFDKHTAAIEEARNAPGVRIAAGGKTDGSKGWFVRPTLLVTDDPSYRTMQEEP